MFSTDTNRSEEHTSELQSRNDISYAVFCLKKKKKIIDYEPGGRCEPLLLLSSVAALFVPGAYLAVFFFFFNDTATTEIYTSLHTLSLHDALPICCARGRAGSTSSSCSA